MLTYICYRGILGGKKRKFALIGTDLVQWILADNPTEQCAGHPCIANAHRHWQTSPEPKTQKKKHNIFSSLALKLVFMIYPFLHWLHTNASQSKYQLNPCGSRLSLFCSHALISLPCFWIKIKTLSSNRCTWVQASGEVGVRLHRGPVLPAPACSLQVVWTS